MAVVVSSWSGPKVSNRAAAIEEVLSTYGNDAADPDLRTVGLRCLDRACNSLNAYIFEFNKLVESGITLEAGTNNYVLSTLFWKESQAYLEKNTGEDQQPLDFLRWAIFKRQFSDDTVTGFPVAYSIFNFERDGRVYLTPAPDSSTVNNFTLAIEYYRRTPNYSGVSDASSPDIPVEAESFLLYAAKMELAIHLKGAGHPDVANFKALSENALQRLIRIDKEHPDAANRFRLIDEPYMTKNRWGKVWGLYARLD